VIGLIGGWATSPWIGNRKVNMLSANVSPVLTHEQTQSDSYEITFSGVPGEQLYATYTITPPSVTQEIRDVLPYKLTFSAPKDSRIEANSSPNKGLEAKIFRNGVECGRSTSVGLYAQASKICQ